VFKVYKKLVSALYMMNIVAQSIVTLLIPAGLMFLLSWLLVSKCSMPTWLYAVLIPIGVISGFVSMIKFVIRAGESVERLEKQNKRK
jgi:hypothetical protein